MNGARRLVLRDVEVAGRRVDVRVTNDLITAIHPATTITPTPADAVVDGHGGALLPGLADRHLHLYALAASAASVDCGPPHTRDTAALAAALRTATPAADGWIRGVGQHQSVGGHLDRAVLDAWQPHIPVRVQHRGGALWTVNGAGARALGLDEPGARLPDGVERDHAGNPTGRLWRVDRWLRERLGPTAHPDLAPVGRLLSRYGVTAVTDATPDLPAETLAALGEAVREGALPQRVAVLGADPDMVRAHAGDRLDAGPYKLLPPDHDPWPYPELVDRIRAARGPTAAPVAVHCVTREGLLLTLAALADAGPAPGDRIEHAAVVPPDVVPSLRDLGVLVVTQPGFIAARGDAYLTDADPDDLEHLYPYASLLRAGVRVHPSSDAPYGPLDPWCVLRAAADRLTPNGVVLGGDERVPVATALRGMLSADAVRPGARADLCLLRAGRAELLRDPRAELVRLTVHGGVVHRDGVRDPLYS